MHRILPALLVLGLLAGCGGGDKQPPASTPTAAASASATPTGSAAPEATATPTPDPQVAIRAEIKALRALTGKRVSSLYYKMDGLALVLGSKRFKADSKMLTRLTNGVSGSGSGIRDDYFVFTQRIQRQEWATMLPEWKRSARKLAKVKARGIAASTRDFQLAEWRVSIALIKEFLGHLRHAPNGQTTFADYYQNRTYGQDTRWPVVIAVPYNVRKQIIRRLKRSDSVGDAYRSLIVDRYVSPLKKTKRREQTVAAQQWMLFRLRQLEDTPRDVYDEARLTILEQSLADARNPYARLRDIGLLLTTVSIGSDGKEVRNLRHLRTWALDQLSRPVSPLLDPTRDQLAHVYRRLDVRGVKPGDPIGDINDFYDRYELVEKKVKKILLRGAKTADSPRKGRRALIQALRATRPGA